MERQNLALQFTSIPKLEMWPLHAKADHRLNPRQINFLPATALLINIYRGNDVLASAVTTHKLHESIVSMANKQAETRLRKSRKSRQGDVIAILGFFLAMATWGYSVISPEPNIPFGLFLLACAAFFLYIAALRWFQWTNWTTKMLWFAVFAGSFWIFSAHVIVRPLHAREFNTLLIAGYRFHGASWSCVSWCRGHDWS